MTTTNQIYTAHIHKHLPCGEIAGSIPELPGFTFEAFVATSADAYCYADDELGIHTVYLKDGASIEVVGCDEGEDLPLTEKEQRAYEAIVAAVAPLAVR